MSKLPSKLVNLVREEFEGTCKRRFFYGPAFEPYGGTAGLYDLGPSACSIKHQLLSLWRQHFVVEENMCEIDTTCLTSEDVFLTSGHVDKFTDVMAKDTKTGECFRLDKLIEDYCEKRLNTVGKGAPTVEEAQRLSHVMHTAGGMNKDELDQVVKEFQLTSPKENPLSPAFDFNLMFTSTIGPEGGRKAYLRPELAQGICLNFKRLMESNCASRLPFAACAIGQAFRNEIAPRSCLIRVREFTLAEIEHFVNPNNKDHEKFPSVKDTMVWVWPRTHQTQGLEPYETSIGQLLADKHIDNQTLAYFVGRVFLFVRSLGLKYIRFRQHLSNEMAFYAQDCWDCELLTSYGWVECVGIADRSAHDLTVHSRKTKKDLGAWEDYPEPIVQQVLDRQIQKGLLGKAFGKSTQKVTEALTALPEEKAMALEAELSAAGKAEIQAEGEVFALTREMARFSIKSEKVSGRSFIPNVIEPSFGLGRIIYSLLEQSYWVRRDDSGKNELRAVFSFPPHIAPFQVAILPLMIKPELLETVKTLRQAFSEVGLAYRFDDSGVAIGRKYARMDELGIPYAVTVDFATDGTVTLRERDSTNQVRVPLKEIPELVASLCRNTHRGTVTTWEEVSKRYPAQVASTESQGK